MIVVQTWILFLSLFKGGKWRWNCISPDNRCISRGRRTLISAGCCWKRRCELWAHRHCSSAAIAAALQGEAAAQPEVLLPVALCLVKMHCLLPTESVVGIWGGEKVIIPQKGKYNAISRHFQWNFRIHKHKDRRGIAATEFHPGKLLGSISFMLQVNATKIFQKLQLYSLH